MPGALKLKRLGIDTYLESVIYMTADCHVCRSEGFAAQSRVQVTLGDRHLIATLNVVTDSLLRADQASLSENAWRLLGATDGASIQVTHPEPLESLSVLRANVYGQRIQLPATRCSGRLCWWSTSTVWVDCRATALRPSWCRSWRLPD